MSLEFMEAKKIYLTKIDRMFEIKRDETRVYLIQCFAEFVEASEKVQNLQVKLDIETQIPGLQGAMTWAAETYGTILANGFRKDNPSPVSIPMDLAMYDRYKTEYDAYMMALDEMNFYTSSEVLKVIVDLTTAALVLNRIITKLDLPVSSPKTEIEIVDGYFPSFYAKFPNFAEYAD